MSSRLWDVVILVGLLCFVGGAVGMALGALERPAMYALPVLGMILVGAGASGKRRAS